MSTPKLSSLLMPQVEQDAQRATVEFNGMRFTIRFLSRGAMQVLARRCLVWKFDQASGRRVQQLDYAVLAKELGAAIIADWSGVTLAVLAKYIPLKLTGVSAEELNAPIPYVADSPDTQDNLRMMLVYVNGLDAFLQEAACDISVFQVFTEEETEAESKNLPSSPAGTSTAAS